MHDPMRISETSTRMILSDIPRGMWLLGVVFVSSGAFVLTVPFWAPEWRDFGFWERAAVLVIGIGHLAGGLYTALKPAATRTVLDRARASGILEVRRLLGRSRLEAQFALGDARDIEIVRSTDSDGDPMFRLRLWLSGSRTLWLQAQAVHGETRTRELADRIRHFLRLA